MLKLLLTLLIGGGIGAALGYFGRCSDGACPLTANWRRGALVGIGLALFFHLTSGPSLTSAEMDQSTAAVQRVTGTNFGTVALQSRVPVVVDFYATWCGPCKRLAPRLDQLAEAFTNQIRFVKVNIDESPELAQQYQVQGVPTLLFLRDGKAVDRSVGLPDSGELEQRLRALAAGK
jgi:thioredoxin 1